MLEILFCTLTILSSCRFMTIKSPPEIWDSHQKNGKHHVRPVHTQEQIGSQPLCHMGTSRLYRNSSENAKVQEENPRKTRRKSCIFMVFSRICWSKPIPKPPENPSDHFEPVSASPDPSRPILHRFYIFHFFFEKTMLVFLCISYIFIICSALEAPRPVPNCRSHFSAQTRVIESF